MMNAAKCVRTKKYILTDKVGDDKGMSPLIPKTKQWTTTIEFFGLLDVRSHSKTREVSLLRPSPFSQVAGNSLAM